VFKAKIEILENMSDNDKIAVNGDDEYLSNLKTGLKIIKFGLDDEFDFFADRIDIGPAGIKFMLNGKCEINLSLMGRHNIYNALAAISVSWDFGVSIDDIKEALAEFRGANMRMEVKDLGDIKVINDSYNSNPLSMKQAIEALKDMTAEGRKILIAGDMLELGTLSGRFHHLVGRQAAESGVDFIIAVGKLADHIAAGAYEAGMSRKNVKLCAVTKEAGEAAVNLVKKGDTVLVKGSRSMRMEDIVKELEERFKSNVTEYC
jgi:UDP-N-acetylmuramoyl-tripeptide--D-alanyl-D-alanine ligase